MPRAIKKKDYIVIDPAIIIGAIKAITKETFDLCQLSLDQCIQDEHTKGAPTLNNLILNHYWAGANDILNILCVRIGLIGKENAKSSLKRNKELR